MKRAIRSCLIPALLLPLAGLSDSCRVVQWGADWGTGFYRGTWNKPLAPASDVDGDGQTADDHVAGWAFSLSEPLNPPGALYDADALSAVFYGGLTLYAADNPTRLMSEGHINQNHEFRDDFNIMAQPRPAAPNERLAAYALFVWQKRDFLNGGERLAVRFDARSRIAVHVSRYWGGVDAGRWVARDGDRFYVSEKTFGDSTAAYHLVEGDKVDGGNNPLTRKTHALAPLESRWAPYAPREPYHLDFDSAAAAFETRAFTNVTAVGFLVTRRLSPARPVARGLSMNEPLGVKFNAFACVADVDSGGESANVDMAASGVPGVLISRSPVSFALWDRVRRAGVTNQRCDLDGFGGYALERGDGAMGTMLADDKPHDASEPATGLTWLDAAAFCNMLSELEGREPAYYEDEAFTRVLRHCRDRNMRENDKRRPRVLWKRGSPGYRLPTRDEWEAAAASKAIGGEPFWNRLWSDQPAGPQGAWLIASRQLAPSDGRSMLAFGDEPAQGAYDVAFRVARGAPAAAAAPSEARTVTPQQPPGQRRQPALRLSARELLQAVLPSLPEVRLAAGLATREDGLDVARFGKGGDTNAPVYEVLTGATEVPYRVWKLVANWAEMARGYSFNYPGDMGSMRVEAGRHTHAQSEPVTYISWHDAVVWCNALSELRGLRPAYYTNEAFTCVYREALPFRVDTYLDPDYPRYPFKNRDRRPPHTGSWTPVFMNAAADGYRLPLFAEFELANRWVEAQSASDFEWISSNAGGQTHPVGTRKPGPTGLYDLQGNVLEWAWGDPGESFGIKRYGGVFTHAFRGVHPNLDAKEFASVARPYVGLRILRRAAPTPAEVQSAQPVRTGVDQKL